VVVDSNPATNVLDDEELEPPDRPDFRRVGKGTPFVLNPEGKRTRYGRPSQAGKILDDESGLTDWKLRTLVIGAAYSPEQMALASTLDPQANKKELRDIAEECLKAGKAQERTVKGVAVHSMFDHLDRHDDWHPAPQWMELCANYLATLELWGLVPVDIEVHCINDEFRLAGSMDRRYRTTKILVAPDGSIIPIGSMVAADTKTGAALEYASGTYVTQLAAYVDSLRYNVQTDEREPFEPPTFQDWALVVHADSGGTEVQMFWVDLEAGRQGLELARQVKGWRRRQDLLTLGTPVSLSSVPAPAPEMPPDSPSSPTDAARVASLHQHTRERVRAVLGHSEVAGKALQRSWPAGVPGLKQECHTWDQLREIIAVVERVEADHSVPFFPEWDDPQDPKERHPSYVDRWAKPKLGDAPANAPDVNLIQDAINQHPRKELLRSWVHKAVEGGVNHSINTFALSHALLEFASINTDGWNHESMTIDEQLSAFLDGALRAVGYQRGLLDLGNINPEHAPLIMAAAFSITAGTAALVYQVDGTPILRTNIVKA